MSGRGGKEKQNGNGGQRGMALTVINFVLLLGIVLSQVRPALASQEVAPMLRGRGLEIVDAQGRVRASISILPQSRADSKDYPETVLLRLINSRGGPIVKIGASENGASMSLMDGSRAFSGVQMLAIDTGTIFVKVRNAKGTEQIIKP